MRKPSVWEELLSEAVDDEYGAVRPLIAGLDDDEAAFWRTFFCAWLRQCVDACCA